MPRLTLLLVAAVLALGAGFAWLAMRPAPTGLDEAAVRSIVSSILAQTKAPASGSMAELDPEALNPMIEDFLMSNPRVLERVNDKLQAEIQVAERAAAKAAISAQHDAIYDARDAVVGNPEGDVTLVQMFDFNCGYCRTSNPDLATLMAEDPKLKIVLKEFPILSKESVDAARVAVLVAQDKSIDFWTFHKNVFAARGQVNGETALAEAEKLGMDRMSIGLAMGTPAVTEVIQGAYALAKALNIGGTPTYIIGDEIIPGAVGIDELRSRIANMRACGSTQCGET